MTIRLHGRDYSAASLGRMAGDLAAVCGRFSGLTVTAGLDHILFTHAVTGDQVARDDVTMTWLAAGESRTYSTTFRIIVQGR